MPCGAQDEERLLVFFVLFASLFGFCKNIFEKIYRPLAILRPGLGPVGENLCWGRALDSFEKKPSASANFTPLDMIIEITQDDAGSFVGKVFGELFVGQAPRKTFLWHMLVFQ